MKTVELGHIKLARVNARDCFVNGAYQRTEWLSASRVRKIAADFDLTAFGILTVKKVGRRYEVIDGQHRLEAMKLVYVGLKYSNGKPVTIVVRVIDEANASKVYRGQNAHCVALSGNAEFKACWHEGGETEVAIVNALDEYDIMIRWGGRGRLGQNQTRAADALRTVFRWLGEDRFDFFVDTLCLFQRPDYDGVVETSALKSEFIRGLGMFLSAAELSDDEVTVGLSHGLSAAAIMDKSNKLSNGNTFSGRRTRLVAEAIEKSARKGLRDAK